MKANSILDKRVQPGMVYTGGSGGSGFYVVGCVTEDTVYSTEIGGKRGYESHGAGYGWFRPGCFEFIRQMGVRESKQYIWN